MENLPFQDLFPFNAHWVRGFPGHVWHWAHHEIIIPSPSNRRNRREPWHERWHERWHPEIAASRFFRAWEITWNLRRVPKACYNAVMFRWCQGIDGISNMKNNEMGILMIMTGWWYTYSSEKWWTSSVGIMTFPIYGKMFQTTNQIILVITMVYGRYNYSIHGV